MLVNSSFASGHPAPSPSSNSSHVLDCLDSTISDIIFTSFCVTTVLLLLPLFIFVFYLGFQRRTCRRSGSTCHSDVFTYHMVAMEILGIFWSSVNCISRLFDIDRLEDFSFMLFFTIWSVKVLFHVLTCVERYVAVVHPITYMRLRNKKGVRIRNISIGFVWLLCLGWTALVTHFDNCLVPYLCSLAFSLIVVCFCSLSVLRVLRCPGPGEVGGGAREQAGQTKKRAFHTTVTILGVLLLCTGGMLMCEVVYVLQLLSGVSRCGLMVSVTWFTLPSSLVLPLLFLHRQEELPFYRRNPK